MANFYSIPGVTVIQEYEGFAAVHVDRIVYEDGYATLRFLEVVRAAGCRIAFQGQDFIVLEPR